MKRVVQVVVVAMAIAFFAFACGYDYDQDDQDQTQFDNPENLESEYQEEAFEAYEEDDLFEDNPGKSIHQASKGNCSWWNRLGQNRRNKRIIIEALYSVDRNINGQNNRIPCSWSNYLKGKCALMGNWAYSNRYPGRRGVGGQCKPFARELLERASGGAASLPGGTYDYRRWYPYRNRNDAIRYAKAGEVLQFTGAALHTAVIISNFHDGRFEVVHSNWAKPNKISKQVINAKKGKWGRANLKSYVIDCY